MKKLFLLAFLFFAARPAVVAQASIAAHRSAFIGSRFCSMLIEIRQNRGANSTLFLPQYQLYRQVQAVKGL